MNSDNTGLIVFFLMILFFWNFGDNNKDLYDVIFQYMEKGASHE